MTTHSRHKVQTTARRLSTLNRFIASKEAVAKPLNFESGESIAYAQLLPTRSHDPLHHLSDGNAFTP
jgi:phosphopantetheinyl transferase (holo-ACP synthase)